MLADALVALRRFQEAAKEASAAERAILQVGESIELGALCRTCGAIRTHEGRAASAREYFTKSVDILGAIDVDARYELALTYLACRQSEAYSTDEQLVCLRKASKLFASKEVHHRVQEINEIKNMLHDEEQDAETHMPYDALAVANTLLDRASVQGCRSHP